MKKSYVSITWDKIIETPHHTPCDIGRFGLHLRLGLSAAKTLVFCDKIHENMGLFYCLNL